MGVNQAQAVSKACRAADAAALAKLLKHGASPDEPWRKWAPLHAVIQEDAHGGKASAVAVRVRCVELLLKAGADPEQRSGWPPTTALIVAAIGGKREIVELLLRRKVAVDAFSAAALGRLGVVNKALKKDRALAKARDASDLTLLHYVAASRMGVGDEKTAAALLAAAKLLLESGADANARAKLWTHEIDPAYFAIGATNLPIAKLLLEHGADPTSALVTAMWNTGDSYAEFGELALAHGAKPDAAAHEGKPLLNQLVRWGGFKQARWLLEHGASPNLPDDRGWTATHQAASRGNKSFWAVIVTAGGHLGRPDREDITPADLAKHKKLPV